MAKTQDKVNDILNTIKKTSDATIAIVDVESTQNVKSAIRVQEVRGIPKSGRIWKTPKQRFSSLRKSKMSHKSFEDKDKLRQQLKETKGASKALLAERQEHKESQKRRRRENIKKTEANRLKSEIVQIISNSAKVKRMKKKQLRFIEKRDTTEVSK